MRVLIINLAAETVRMAFQGAQMTALGLEWERLEATTPETLPVPFDNPRWQRWERPMRAAEVALLASHIRAWERIRAADAPHLIVEDDALLAVEVPAFLEGLELEQGPKRACMIQIDHIGLEARRRKKLVGRWHPTLPVRRLYQDRTGSAAYVLWPSGAEKLLARAAVRPGLSDAVINAAYEMRSWQTDPALAVQLDQCAAYGLPQPIFTESSMGTEPAPPGRGLHRARRIAAQLRIGLRHLSKIAVAERRQIALSTNWPVFHRSRDGCGGEGPPDGGDRR